MAVAESSPGQMSLQLTQQRLPIADIDAFSPAEEEKLPVTKWSSSRIVSRGPTRKVQLLEKYLSIRPNPTKLSHPIQSNVHKTQTCGERSGPL